MIVSEYIKLANQEATGETDVPSTDSEAYIALYNQVPILVSAWQNAVDAEGKYIDWESLWARTTLPAAIVPGQDTYSLTTGLVRYLSTEDGGFNLVKSDGSLRPFQVVKPSELSLGGDRVAFSKDQLLFAEPLIASDEFIGADIKFAYYGFAQPITGASSVIPVDDPYWVVYRGASSLARNDYVKGGQYNNILNLAKEKWDAMVSRNRKTANNTVNHGISYTMFPGAN